MGSERGVALLVALGLILFAGVPLGSADEGSKQKGGGKAKVEVDIFVSVDCPIANSYSPEINRLHERFAPLGVRFRLVYPETTLKVAEMVQHRQAYALAPDGTLDPEHRLVKRAGASTTPEVAVFDTKGELCYRGKIDDRYSDYGDRRKAANEKYLERVLERLLAGESVAFQEQKAIGCLIEPLATSER